MRGGPAGSPVLRNLIVQQDVAPGQMEGDSIVLVGMAHPEKWEVGNLESNTAGQQARQYTPLFFINN